jgi:hypothetical protein
MKEEAAEIKRLKKELKKMNEEYEEKDQLSKV